MHFPGLSKGGCKMVMVFPTGTKKITTDGGNQTWLNHPYRGRVRFWSQWAGCCLRVLISPCHPYESWLLLLWPHWWARWQWHPCRIRTRHVRVGACFQKHKTWFHGSSVWIETALLSLKSTGLRCLEVLFLVNSRFRGWLLSTYLHSGCKCRASKLYTKIVSPRYPWNGAWVDSHSQKFQLKATMPNECVHSRTLQVPIRFCLCFCFFPFLSRNWFCRKQHKGLNPAGGGCWEQFGPPSPYFSNLIPAHISYI